MHPLIVRRLLLPLHERLLRRPTLPYLNDLEASQWLTLDQFRALQARKLRRLLAHAWAACPFYRRRLDDAAIDPGRATLDDLARLPTIDKDTMSLHAKDLIDPASAHRARDAATGGSTGAPLHFKIDKYRQAADQAARARSRRWFGIDLGERELYLWGSPVEQAAQDRFKSLRDRITNHRLLNAFRMTPRRMSQYLAEITRFDPVHIFGYPSSLARLCEHALDAGVPLRAPSLRAIFVTGEVLLPADRARIEEYFAVAVADGYGAREAGFIAHQCPHGGYHVTMESLIVEIVDPRGRLLPDGQLGEIVITHLDARAMPFIRYRTGDLARKLPGVCPCGRHLERLDGIQGRRTDMLRTADGGHAHALSVIYVLRDEPAIARFQVVQQPDLSLDVHIVPRGSLAGDVNHRITKLLRRQIGPTADIRIHARDEIPPAPSGKHHQVIGI